MGAVLTVSTWLLEWLGGLVVESQRAALFVFVGLNPDHLAATKDEVTRQSDSVRAPRPLARHRPSPDPLGVGAPD
jgi:hypothetical protein